jgi:hypothetical protein
MQVWNNLACSTMVMRHVLQELSQAVDLKATFDIVLNLVNLNDALQVCVFGCLWGFILFVFNLFFPPRVCRAGDWRTSSTAQKTTGCSR